MFGRGDDGIGVGIEVGAQPRHALGAAAEAGADGAIMDAPPIDDENGMPLRIDEQPV